MIEQAGIREYKTLGLTRAYTTRHGAGPFPTYCQKLTSEINDCGNPVNDWQGAIQAGPLDLVLLRYAANSLQLDGLVVNNLDELPELPMVCGRYRELDDLPRSYRITDQEALTEQLGTATPELRQVSREELLGELHQIAPIAIKSYGPTHRDREPSFNGKPQATVFSKTQTPTACR